MLERLLLKNNRSTRGRSVRDRVARHRTTQEKRGQWAEWPHDPVRRQAPDQPSKRLCLAKRPRVRYQRLELIGTGWACWAWRHKHVQLSKSERDTEYHKSWLATRSWSWTGCSVHAPRPCWTWLLMSNCDPLPPSPPTPPSPRSHAHALCECTAM